VVMKEDWCERCNYLGEIVDYYEHGDQLAAICVDCAKVLPA